MQQWYLYEEKIQMFMIKQPPPLPVHEFLVVSKIGN